CRSSVATSARRRARRPGPWTSRGGTRLSGASPTGINVHDPPGRISMDEHGLRALVGEVKAGRLSRRRFVQLMVGLGLTAPMAAQMLASAGVAEAQLKWASSPTKRGGGGLLKTLWWQAPTLLNPHFAVGTKDQDASRIFYEPLASFDPDGNLVPFLAAEIPSLQNGGVAKDGRSVTWRLKKNVLWHDGKPFTADD